MGTAMGLNQGQDTKTGVDMVAGKGLDTDVKKGPGLERDTDTGPDMSARTGMAKT